MSTHTVGVRAVIDGQPVSVAEVTVENVMADHIHNVETLVLRVITERPIDPDRPMGAA